MKTVKKWLIKLCSITPFTKQLAIWASEFIKKIIYRFFFRTKYKVDDKLILFEAYMGEQVSCSPKALYEEMKKDVRYKNYIKVWALKNPQAYQILESDENTILVKHGSSEYYKYCAMAKCWITNSRMPRCLEVKPEQKYIQCWHGTPLKRLGYDIECYCGTKSATKEMRKTYRMDAKRYSAILSPSAFCTEKLTSAFNLKALGKDNIFIQKGYPRNDFLYSYTPEDAEQIKTKLSIPKDKKVILYAPTYRENQHEAGAGYVYDLKIDFDRLLECLGEEYVILFRTHYFVSSRFDFEKYNGFIIDVSRYDDINHLYVVSDLLVTDYSSVMFDYANLKRPMIFYMYDMEEYKEDMRGFYIDLEELPGEIVQKEVELIQAIKETSQGSIKYHEKYQKFNSKYNPYANVCSSEVLEEIFDIIYN